MILRRNCRRSPCSHGKKIYPSRLTSSLIGCSVKYCGQVWAEEKRKRPGLVTGVSGGHIQITWKGSTKPTTYPLMIKNKDAQMETCFQYFCIDSDGCPNCQSSPCRTGTAYEAFREVDLGLRLLYVGPDRSVLGWVGEVQGALDNFLIIKWINNSKNSKYKVKDSNGKFLFEILCNHISQSDKKDLKTETEGFKDYAEDEDDTEEAFVLLSDPTAKILDVDLDTELCRHCQVNVSQCLNGKQLLYYHEQNVGKQVKYCGSFDGTLRGRVGVIEGFLTGCLAIVWQGQTEASLYPLLIPRPDSSGLVSYRDQQAVEHQFQFCCLVDESSISNHQLSSEALSQSNLKWFLLKLEMYQVLPLSQFDYDRDGPRCENCGTLQSRCLHGQYLINLTDVKVGLSLKFVGQNDNFHGNIGKVSEVKRGHFRLNWSNQECNSNRNLSVTSADKSGTHLLQFKFHCVRREETTHGNEEPSKKEVKTFVVQRLPILQCWRVIQHKETKDKHKIIFTVSKQITLCGVGINLASPVTRVSMTVCRKSVESPSPWSDTLAGAMFSNVEAGYKPLYFQKPVKVLPTETYMVVVSFNGGSSYFYSGGLECVKANTDGGQSVIFKFESDGDDQQINVVEEGVIPSIYFNTL